VFGTNQVLKAKPLHADKGRLGAAEECSRSQGNQE